MVPVFGTFSVSKVVYSRWLYLEESHAPSHSEASKRLRVCKLFGCLWALGQAIHKLSDDFSMT